MGSLILEVLWSLDVGRLGLLHGIDEQFELHRAAPGRSLPFTFLKAGPIFPAMRRELLKDVTRIVVKLGTGVLTDSRKQPDLAQMEQLVAQIAAQRKAGREIIL